MKKSMQKKREGWKKRKRRAEINGRLERIRMSRERMQIGMK